MTDFRQNKSNGRVAHISQTGLIKDVTFVEGDLYRVGTTVAPLLTESSGVRTRELVFGEAFHALETVGDLKFGFCARDGYCGYIRADALRQFSPEPTHRVLAARSFLKESPHIKSDDARIELSYGSQLHVIEVLGNWAAVKLESQGREAQIFYVPSKHVALLSDLATDPVNEAAKFIGTPYLWGGNSSFGIDCSGLVQTALLACGVACPGDSDQQEAALEDASGAYRRGDLLFWKGHVALIFDNTTLIHANAHHMAVALENTQSAIDRIASQGDGPVTAHKRAIRKEKA